MKRIIPQSGFTFLEVMIAVAVISIALVTLIGSQSQSVSIVTISRQNLAASFLAQQKLAELEASLYDDLYSDSGRFEDDFSQYGWRTEVSVLGPDETEIEGTADMLKSIDLVITMGETEEEIYTLRSIVMKEIVPEER
jgi:general secretion pathway protein I